MVRDTLTTLVHFLQHYAQPYFTPECIQLFRTYPRDLQASLNMFCNTYRVEHIAFKELDEWICALQSHLTRWCAEVSMITNDHHSYDHFQVYVDTNQQTTFYKTLKQLLVRS